MAYSYPDHEIRWPDGSSVPAELKEMLRGGLDPGFEIEHAEFAWNDDNGLDMEYRLSVTRGRRKPQIWEIRFTYPAEDATAARPDASAGEREWFTMMVRTHITEWWERGPTIVTHARFVK